MCFFCFANASCHQNSQFPYTICDPKTYDSTNLNLGECVQLHHMMCGNTLCQSLLRTPLIDGRHYLVGQNLQNIIISLIQVYNYRKNKHNKHIIINLEGEGKAVEAIRVL